MEAPGLKFSKELGSCQNTILFPEKLKKANEILLRMKFPEALQ